MSISFLSEVLYLEKQEHSFLTFFSGKFFIKFSKKVAISELEKLLYTVFSTFSLIIGNLSYELIGNLSYELIIGNLSYEI